MASSRCGELHSGLFREKPTKSMLFWLFDSGGAHFFARTKFFRDMNQMTGATAVVPGSHKLVPEINAIRESRIVARDKTASTSAPQPTRRPTSILSCSTV